VDVPTVTLFVNDSDFQLYVGDVREQLRQLPDESVHCVVSSPPYWGLRAYLEDGHESKHHELGLEPTPEQYVANMVDVFREVRRVLRRDGTCFVNLGDSYISGQGGRQSSVGEMPAATLAKTNVPRDRDDVDTAAWGSRDVTSKTTPARGTTDLKPKDLAGVPWMVAFALRADGWYLRSDIVWSKPNPMPESVTDRPTKAHEYVFLLTRSPRYFFDADAVREQWTDSRNGASGATVSKFAHPGAMRQDGGVTSAPQVAGRNIRSVWEIATQPYPEAHFATFPEALPERCIKAGTSERGCCPVCGAPWERQTEASNGYEDMLTRQPHKDEWDLDAFAAYLSERRAAAGLSSAAVDTAIGTNGAFAWWERANLKRAATGQFRVPTWANYERLKAVLALDDRFDESLSRYRVRIEGGWKIGAHADGFINAKEGKSVSRSVTTTGWRPSCDHDLEPVPCVTLDPFMGSGTTALVARRLGRRSIGVELSPEYAAICAKRLQQLSLFAGADR
jgi:DNA modification methylase